MFRPIFGFDPEIFKYATPIHIEDLYQDVRGRIMLGVRTEVDHTNITGNYLVKSCYVTQLHIINANGKEYSVTADYFNGDNPRMSLRVLQ